VESLLAEASIVVMHNVFDFFMDKPTVCKMWRFIMGALRRPSCRLVCSPSLEVCFESAGLDCALLQGWVRQIPLSPTAERDGDSDEEEDTETSHVHIYEIIADGSIE